MEIDGATPQNDINNNCYSNDDKYSSSSSAAVTAEVTGTMARSAVSRMKEWENRVWKSCAEYEKAQAEYKQLFVFEKEKTTETCCNHSPLEVEFAEERLRSAHEALKTTSDDYYLPAVKRQIPVAVYCINEGTTDDPTRREVCDDLLLRRARRSYFEAELKNLARGASARGKLAEDALEGRRNRMLDCLLSRRRRDNDEAVEVKTEEAAASNNLNNNHHLPAEIGTLRRRTPSSSPIFAKLVLKEAKVAAKYARKNEAMVRRERAYVQSTVMQDLQDEIKAWRRFELPNDNDGAVVDFDKPNFLARRRKIASVLAATGGSEEEKQFREADRKFREARGQLVLLNYKRLRVLEPGPDAPRFIVPRGEKIRDEIRRTLFERNRIEESLFPTTTSNAEGENDERDDAGEGEGAAGSINSNDANAVEREISEHEQTVVEEWDRKVEGSKLAAYYNWFRNHNGVLKANPSYRWGESHTSDEGKKEDVVVDVSTVLSTGKRKRVVADCDDIDAQRNGKRR